MRIYVTSLALLRNADTTNQNHIAIFHLDGTYRITINNFPLSVFGRSDMNRKFFPIALAILSREKADDILAFLLAITKVCKHFNINFVVRFCMIDAAPEEAKAIREMNTNPNIINMGLNWCCFLLMCWFHMKKNIREPRNAGCKELKPVYDDILHACDSLHYCTSHQAFEDKKFEILSSWSALV